MIKIQKWENGDRLSLRYSALNLRVDMCAAQLKYRYCFRNEEVFFETFEEAKAAGIERFRQELIEVLAELDGYERGGV